MYPHQSTRTSKKPYQNNNKRARDLIDTKAEPQSFIGKHLHRLDDGLAPDKRRCFNRPGDNAEKGGEHSKKGKRSNKAQHGYGPEPARLPQEIIAFSNADKKWHEKWTDDRDLLNFPHPNRVVLTGPPNRGKTTIVKNLIARAWPPFQRVVIVYPGGHEGTSEYDDIKGASVEFLDAIPETDWWPTVKDGAEKTLCIIDDFELKQLDKKSLSNLDRLSGHVSTHRNVTLYICAQNFYNIPPIVRRTSDLFIMWAPRDMTSINSVADRVGLDLHALFKQCPEQHDSLWVDLTPKSPAPIRKNGFELLQPVEERKRKGARAID